MMRFKTINILALITLLLFALPGKSQDTKDEKFRRGAELYKSGNYDEALKLWIEVYNNGYRSAELDYNIGNAYFKLNNIPGAILFFERAHLLKPADEDVNYNLAIAKTLVVDRFNEIPELFFVRWYNFLSLILSSNNWAKFSISAFIICLLFLSVYFYSSRYRLKVIGFWLAVILLVFSASSLTFSSRNRSLVSNSRKAVIFKPLVNGKSSPDSSGTDLFVLHEGTIVTVGEKVGEWYEIRLSDGNKGWIPVNSLEKI
jgi:hypothetical protein